jgi:hypothetical protein
MSEPRHRREPKPWKNVRTQAPLPPPHPDRWQWLPGEIVFGKQPQRPASWVPPTEPRQQADD